MDIVLRRFLRGKDETIGGLYLEEFECYVLEDLPRFFKIFGRTRIPEGKYEIKLRFFGEHYKKYCKRFNENHPMLQLMDVPNYTNVLIHIGNSHLDTAGCLLLGESYYKAGKNYFLRNSTKAYLAFHKKIVPVLLKGEKVFVIIEDEK